MGLIELYLTVNILNITQFLIMGHEPEFLFETCSKKLTED
jgi:hypothetical protein